MEADMDFPATGNTNSQMSHDFIMATATFTSNIFLAETGANYKFQRGFFVLDGNKHLMINICALSESGLTFSWRFLLKI
jgi:hypothetical protein